LGHLFEEWDLREQAEYVRSRLVEANLLEPDTGRLRIDTFQAYLTSIGTPEPKAVETIRRMQSFKGAYKK